MLPPILAVPVMAALVMFAGMACWKSRNAQPGSSQFAWTLALLVSVTVTLATQAAHYQILLLPALLMLLASVRGVRKKAFLVRTLTKGTFACLYWQWGTALGLALVSVFEPAARLRRLAEVPMYTLIALPLLALLATVSLYPSIDEWDKSNIACPARDSSP